MEKLDYKLIETNIVNKGFYKLLLCNGLDFVSNLQKEYDTLINNTSLQSLCIEIVNEYRNKIPLIQQELNDLCALASKNPNVICCERVFEWTVLKFEDLFDLQTNNLIKPNNVRSLFESKFELVLNHNLCSYREYEKNYISLNSFPIEIRYMWNLFKNEIKTNYDQLFKLLNEKFFIRIIKHKVTNEYVCFQITSESRYWRVLDSNELDFKSLIIGILKYMAQCPTNDLRKILCYLSKDRYDLFPVEEKFAYSEIKWSDVMFINKTFENNKIVWASVKHDPHQHFINSGFYMLLPEEIPQQLTENELEILLREQYKIKRILYRSGFVELCCWLEKNSDE